MASCAKIPLHKFALHKEVEFIAHRRARGPHTAPGLEQGAGLTSKALGAFLKHRRVGCRRAGA